MKKLLSTIGIAAILTSAGAFAQGPLTPPGAPAPTMKTLQQVEPRTDLLATPAPAGVDASNASYHYIINQPGSYYLSANLGVTKTNGIQINAENVTLDLNGFQVSRTSAAGGNGIEISSLAPHAAVRNGSMKGFACGLQAFAPACALRDLVASGCASGGLLGQLSATVESCRAHNNAGTFGVGAGTGSTLTNCVSYENTTTYAIYASDSAVVSHCAAYGNTATFGIFLSTDGTVTHCVADGNTSHASSSSGFYLSPGCTATDCSARFNGTSAPGSPLTGVGFFLSGTATIERCTASLNSGDGIYVSSDGAHVVGNTCDGNAPGVQGSGGIHVGSTANGCRIDGNHCTYGARGFFIEGNDNLIVRNSAWGASVNNYDIAAGNHDAARVTSPGSSFAGTSPWANFSF